MDNSLRVSNPFLEKAEGEATDRALVAQAVDGDQGALEALITRHQPWIYNLALPGSDQPCPQHEDQRV